MTSDEALENALRHLDEAERSGLGSERTDSIQISIAYSTVWPILRAQETRAAAVVKAREELNRG